METHTRRVRSDISHDSDSHISHRDNLRILRYAYRIYDVARIRTPFYDEYGRLVRRLEEVDDSKDSHIRKFSSDISSGKWLLSRYVLG